MAFLKSPFATHNHNTTGAAASDLGGSALVGNGSSGVAGAIYHGSSDRWMQSEYERLIKHQMLSSGTPPMNGLLNMMLGSGDIESDEYRAQALFFRLHIPTGKRHPFQHLTTALAKDKVHVFVMHNDIPVMFEDARELFPSDTLITQLRLMMQ